MKAIAPIPPTTSAALSDVCKTASLAFAQASSGELNVIAALSVAESVDRLRALLDTPEVKERILALQDTSIGFRTDRDPHVKNRKTGEYNQPYPWPVVRDCALEASLRGLQWVGNQFNIITGRCYATKEAFEYLIRRCKHVTGFKPVISVPRIANGGALVECSATWKLNGEAVSYACTIPVKTDDFSGADQIIGKATRKFLKRCYEQMAGISVPEADTEDASVEAAVDVTPREAKATPRPAFSKPSQRAIVPKVPEDDQIPGAEVPPVAVDPAAEPSVDPAPASEATPVDDAPALSEAQATLSAFVEDCGGTFDHFKAAMARLNWFPGADGWGGFMKVPDDAARRLLRAKHGLRTEIGKEVGR